MATDTPARFSNLRTPRFIGEVRDDDVVAFIVRLLAHLRGDRLYRAAARQRERRRGKAGETEIGGAGGQRLDHVLIRGIGGHLDIEALGLEVALLDAEKQHGVGNAARGADGNALLRGGGRQQSGDEREGSKGGKGGTNHARTIAKAEPIRPLRCHPRESGDPYAVRYRGAAEYGSRPSLTLGRDDSWCYFKFPQKRWMRVQASSRSDVLVA